MTFSNNLPPFSFVPRHAHENCSEQELERVLRKRGSDYDSMVQVHNRQKAFEENVAKSLIDMGLKVEMASRYSILLMLLNTY